ncbi:MAG: winged helix-turn-helix transcriptional regulator [Thermoplasmata archaeon]
MNESQLQERLLEVLEDILKWTRFSGIEGLRKVIEALDDQDKLIYHYADGNRTTREIAERVASSQPTVSRRLQELEKRKLVTKNDRNRWEHIAPLSFLGLEVPDLGDA